MKTPDIPEDVSSSKDFAYKTDFKPSLKITERVETMTKAQLLDIVAQPHVEEDEWVAACHELERRGETALIKPQTTPVSRSMTARAVTAIVIILLATTSFGLIRYFSAQPAAAPVAPPVIARADVDYGPYMANLQRRIKRGWYPPKGFETTRVKVVFKIDSDGHMDHLRLLLPTKLEAANEAALAAVRNATFQPLPDGAPKNVDIEFTFDYNVLSK